MKPGRFTRVEHALGRVMGREIVVRDARALGGGSMAQTTRIETSGGSFVLKAMDGGGAEVLAAEARGLLALAAAESGLRVPAVIHLELEAPAFLVLEYLAPAAPRSDFDERLGRGLALLHRSTSPFFGFESDNFCGATPQPNPPTSKWCEFYAEHRLRPQVTRAASAGLLSPTERRSLERFIDALSSRISEPPEGPALIHGDLWSGNSIVDDGGLPAIIDPACYFAHREAELGMMTLFGGFSGRVYSAYEEAFPLAPGWRDRNPVYQVYHLLNHLNLFGASYRAQVMGLIRASSVA